MSSLNHSTGSVLPDALAAWRGKVWVSEGQLLIYRPIHQCEHVQIIQIFANIFPHTSMEILTDHLLLQNLVRIRYDLSFE